MAKALLIPTTRDVPMLPMAVSTLRPPSAGCGFSKGARPDRWDIIGAAVIPIGAAIIPFGPRPT